MPVDRPKKPSTRHIIYERQKTQGIEMPACSRCEKRGKKCLVAPGYSRCSECIRAGGRVKCDVHGPSDAEWKELERTEKKLADEWNEAQSEQRKLFERLSEMSAKLVRIEKQRETFRSRAAEMLRRGLKSIAELDAAEEQERREKEAEGEVGPEEQPTSVPSDDPSLFWNPEEDLVLVEALSEFDASSTFWSSLGFGVPGGGTPATSQGS